MKILNSFLLIILLIGLTSCNNSKRENAEDLNHTDINLNDTADDMSGGNTTISTNSSNPQYNDIGYLYRKLNMTPEQVSQFESKNPNFRDSIGNSQWRRNATMDKSMRSILSADQYKHYETWWEERNSNMNNSTNSLNDTNTQTNSDINNNNQ